MIFLKSTSCLKFDTENFQEALSLHALAFMYFLS